MAKAKISLTAKPTFKKIAPIHVPGDKPVGVEFVFKYRDKEQLKEFTEGLVNREDMDILLDIVTGWDLDDDFNETTLEQLATIYAGSARSILEVYISELTGARAKN